MYGWDEMPSAMEKREKALPTIPDQRDMIHRVFDRVRGARGEAAKGAISPLAEPVKSLWLRRPLSI